jgi:ABC-2 type transport system permease protein
MRTFFTVLKNNYLRSIPRIVPLMFITAFTLASMFFAVYMTGQQQVKGHIAVISNNAAETMMQDSRYLDITVLPEKPPRSALVEQKFDAYVMVDGSGDYSIETLRNDEFKNMLIMLLNNPDASMDTSKTERGVGVNILGFMMLFLLMISFGNLFAFADDKEQGQLRRIAASPASFGWYLAAHYVYCLSFLLPEYLLLVILKLCGYNLGFSLAQFALLMLILSSLGISFGLFLNTLFHKPDNANMLGNSVTVLTSILAGSFYSFSRNNAFLDKITSLIPQKDFMDFAQHLQNGEAAGHIWPIIYVVAFTLTLLVFSCLTLRRMYVKKV